jgi:hypothetical protein
MFLAVVVSVGDFVGQRHLGQKCMDAKKDDHADDRHQPDGLYYQWMHVQIDTCSRGRKIRQDWAEEYSSCCRYSDYKVNGRAKHVCVLLQDKGHGKTTDRLAMTFLSISYFSACSLASSSSACLR